ncbi:MAG: hypothetical protein AAF399_26690 [Bacteroidota bacterium]
MRHLRTYLLLLSFCCIWRYAPAQVPGYSGFRTLLQIEGNAFPAALQAIQGNGLGVNLWPSLSIEHVISRRTSVGATSFWYDSQTRYDYEGRSGQVQLTGLAVGAFVRSYAFLRRGHMAPIGIFQQVELSYLRHQLTDVDQQFYSDGRPDLGRFPDIRLGISMGSQRILPPHFVLHWQVTGAWLFGAFAPIEPLFPVEEVYLHRIATARLRGVFGLSIKGGIGILLF